MTFADLLKEEDRSRLEAVRDDIDRKKKEEADSHHRASHIFSTYEEALDYLVSTPDSSIRMYWCTLQYIPETDNFRSFEQAWDYEGINCWDVNRYYTRQQLLDMVEEHERYMVGKYPEAEHKFKDEWGNLEYVYVI